MRRGDIWLIEFEPVRGSEANNRRPAVIVSNDRANVTAARLSRGVATVIPVTSNVAKIYPFQVLLPASATSLSVDSKAQVEQVRSVDIERLSQPVGRVSPAELARIDDALRLHLDI